MSEHPSYGKVLLTFARNSLIRDMTFRTNFLPSLVGTHSYLFNLPAGYRTLPVVSIVTANGAERPLTFPATSVVRAVNGYVPDASVVPV
jgi:hypothetical protein